MSESWLRTCTAVLAVVIRERSGLDGQQAAVVHGAAGARIECRLLTRR
jgi:hypothetical protein